MKAILLVGLGGGIGSILRYLTTLLTAKWSLNSLSPATLIANILGCLLIGLFISSIENKGMINQDLKLLLVTGFCGGFTTFSTFSLENIQLIQNGHVGQAILYSLTSIIVGLVAVLVGIQLIKVI
ncbi:MAG TPA: fluoride efflux transporter CrcB [Taishania sp.]|nr:fluoride efflux transporter CrcB [Taishania sp.]